MKVVRGNLIASIATGAAVLVVAGALIYSSFFVGGVKILSADAASKKAVDYINNNLVADKTDGVAFKKVETDGTLYKVTISFQDQDSFLYVTKDGRYIFPEMQGIPIDMDKEVTPQTATSDQVKTCEAVKKETSPVVSAFVVSNCPYGLQMQRVLAKAIQTIPTANIKVRYMGAITDGKITSMHGDAEAQENLKQICIREEQPAKYWNYISCYIKAGDTAGCLTSTGVNQTSLTTCTTDANRGLAYTQEDFDLSNQYAVQGSPTLVLGGDQIDEFSFGGRTVDSIKTFLCCGFSGTKPAYCSQTLSQESAASSFSTTYTSVGATNNNNTCGQ